MTKAPWTIDQVHALNAYQRLGYVHEFTCPENHQSSRTLVAKPDGWHCPSCDYRQDWAHDWMADKSLHPQNPIDLFKQRR